MRVLSLGLVALLGRAAAVDSCTQANSGSCCKGYTYNDMPLHLRTTAPVCDGSVPPGPGVTPPTCSGHDPVCTAIDRIPEGSFHGTLYCGNPFPNDGSGTVKGTTVVEVGLCPSPMNGYCFILTATAPAGTTLKADFKVQISTAPLIRDNPGQFATKVTTQPVYVPFSLVYGASYPCDTLDSKTVYIGFHAEEGTETCWAGGDERTTLQTIPGGNSNWALQFAFSYTCKEICKSYCCCPAPPTVPDCPADYSESCPGRCDTPGAQCKTIPIYNLPNWGSPGSLYADKCCCKPPDNPGDCTAPFTIRNDVAPGTLTCSASSSSLSCNDPLKGSIADCHTGLYNEACCCCSPDYSTSCAAPAMHNPGACSGSPPPLGCTTKTDNCGNQFCCCQATVGTCSTETAFGVPSDCAANTVCDAAHYPGVITLQSKGCGRWGWVIDTGDLAAAGSKTYKLHKGGGQNNLGHGADVGSVTIKHCTEGSTTWCAFFTTTSGNVITSAHVEADCDALSMRTTQNFPCAPGGYNDNGGNSCGTNGLPGTSWTSQPFETCTSNHYFVILHAAVANNDPDCTSTNCGDKDEDLGSA